MNNVPQEGHRFASSHLVMEPPSSRQLDSFGPWQDYIHDHFPWLEYRNRCHDDFSARVRGFRASTFAFSTIRASASEVIRTPYLAKSAEEGFIKLIWQISGSLQLQQDGFETTLMADEGAICDTDRPYRIALRDNAHFAVLMIPQDTVLGWNALSPHVCGRKLRDVARPKIAFGALLTLLDVPVPAFHTEADTVLKAVKTLITASLDASRQGLTQPIYSDDRMHKAEKFILDHIDNPTLRAEELASALSMSRRALYLLFEEYGLTPGKMISDLRIACAYRCLDDESNRSRKMTDIALDLGFRDYATFSRLFRVRYGIPPSEHRLRRRSVAARMEGRSSHRDAISEGAMLDVEAAGW